MTLCIYAGFLLGMACLGYMCGLATNRRDALRQYIKGRSDGAREARKMIMLYLGVKEAENENDNHSN